MKPKTPTLRLSLAALALCLWLPAQAQNVAIVNGKPVPTARLEVLLQQATRGGQVPVTPEIEARVREEAVLREIFAQEAERRGVARSPAYRAQMELARQTLLIRELFAQWQRDNPVTEAEARAEYERVRREEAGTEFRARHILVETEDEARRLIAQIRGGADFAELATRHSKDPGSARAGGDLDFARPEAYVPEFGQALARLQRGQVTENPVRTQFGWHIIRLDETREVQFPPFEAVRPQIEQQLAQDKLQKFQLSLRDGARTDFRFSR